MAHFVSLGTLITRVRQRVNAEGDTRGITDYEIADAINCSLAAEVYDLVRQAVTDNYYRKTFPINILSGVGVYDLPGDHLSLISVDVYLQPQTGVPSPLIQQRINARRATESERNLFAWPALLGWSTSVTVLYMLTGSQITFQPVPLNTLSVSLNYVPVAPTLGGGPQPGVTPSVPCNYTDQWDDINSWSEIAVLDAARKCMFKKNRLDMAMALASEKDRLKSQVKSLLPLRNAGEPLRPNYYQRADFGNGWQDD